jgi:hypothetical protein
VLGLHCRHGEIVGYRCLTFELRGAKSRDPHVPTGTSLLRFEFVTCCPSDCLPQADDPFCAEDRFPDRCQLDRDHDDRTQQCNQEHEPVLLEIGERDQRDH